LTVLLQAAFQTTAVLHAMKFPRVQRISYSTCSIHAAENEDVVAAVLAAAPPGFEVTTALPQWPHRGLPGYPFSAHVVRTDPLRDGCIGFFLALFERKTASDTTPPAAGLSKSQKKRLRKKNRAEIGSAEGVEEEERGCSSDAGQPSKRSKA
jgi:putative methyltransferase